LRTPIPRTPPTYTSTLSLHDALPICLTRIRGFIGDRPAGSYRIFQACQESFAGPAALHVFLHLEAERVVQLFVEVIGKFREHLRSEEHTSELQSLAYLVCLLLLEI